MKSILITCLVALTIVISITICWADEEKSHICFNTVDADKDSKVTFKEFSVYFGNNQDKFNQVDQDGDGKLSHDEYHKSLGHGA